MPPAQTERQYVEGTAWWRCFCGHEWDSPSREYEPEPGDGECSMITAEDRGDDCPKCGRTDADSIDFEPWR